mgnify:FL=1|jgi:membrane-associated phospholipid phosphatase|tara:strand:- start:6644 stop:7873 length:1230 start_codon:yes stop_codon:yes gene_type:complete
MFVFKAFTDHHNEPLKELVGGYTHFIYAIEGNFVHGVQSIIKSEMIIQILSLHYLFAYLFIIWYPPVHHILSGDRDLADLSAMNYVFIYLLAVPFYLFFNVEVTSSYVPGVEALMYHDSWNIAFFTSNDPFDNGVPSLHIGLPISLLLIHRAHLKANGIEISKWRHRGLDRFIMANVAIYSFSILYLGIHWVTDILPGLLLAVICSKVCIHIQPLLRESGIKGSIRTLIDPRHIKAILFAIILGMLSISASINGPGTDSDHPDFRMEGDDVRLDTLEIHSLSTPTVVTVTNVGDVPVQILLVGRDFIEPLADRGFIDFESALVHGSSKTLEAGSEWSFEHLPENLLNVDVILMRSVGGSDEIAEVSILAVYPYSDMLLVSGILLCLPSFGLMGLFVGLVRSERRPVHSG